MIIIEHECNDLTSLNAMLHGLSLQILISISVRHRGLSLLKRVDIPVPHDLEHVDHLVLCRVQLRGLPIAVNTGFDGLLLWL